jgi:uncharacterized protein YxjI
MRMLDYHQFLIKEHVGILKFCQFYDIYDPETKVLIGQVREEMSWFKKILSLVIDKRWMPQNYSIFEGSIDEMKKAEFTLHRPFRLIRDAVQVLDSKGMKLGYFKQKLLNIGGAFYIYDANDQEIGMLKGNLIGWNFKLFVQGKEVGFVNKEWAGIAKEFFTTADQYMIQIDPELPMNTRLLLFAAGIAIDSSFKE